MKIGIYDPYLDTMSGGEKYMLTIANCLAKYHEVSIFWDMKAEESIRLKAKHRFDFDLERISFVPNIFSPRISFLSRYKKSKEYDYIFLLSDGSIPVLSSRVIIHFQSPVEWVKMTLKTKIKFKKIYKVICNSAFTKTFIDRKFGVKSSVIYPPVSIFPTSVKKENMILHVGRYGINATGSSYKKQDILADAFKVLVDDGLVNWQLTFVMSVMDRDEASLQKFKKECAGYPISIIVNPKNEVLWENYSKAKIYWHASGFGEDLRVHPDRAEHFGMSTVEAMGCGAVPIVIAAGGQKEIVDHDKNGYLWGTIEELLTLTKAVVKDPKLQNRLSHNARVKADAFSSEKFCQTISSLIK